jgi:hypothetical protein
MTDLLLKRATASPGEVYNVMCEERIVGRIMLSADAQFVGASAERDLTG